MRSTKSHRGLLYILTTLGPATLGGGCNLSQWAENDFKLGPNYVRPEAPIAKRWLDDEDTRIETQAPDHEDWWTVFSDDVLVQLVEQAAAQNLSLREAGYRILQARAQRDIAVGNLFPQQQVGTGSFSWNQVSENSGAPQAESTARIKLADGINAVRDPVGYRLITKR